MAPVSVGERTTVKRADLVDTIFRNVGLSRSESKWMVELMLMEISGALLRGEEVKLSGFGSFKSRSKSARVGRNPKTGVEATRLLAVLSGQAGLNGYPQLYVHNPAGWQPRSSQ
jgi:nucleoid DNA-binding protein